jgi:hypothetical protein
MNFQSESKRSGDEFENFVLSDLKKRHDGIIKKNVFIDDIGCEIDFIIYSGYYPLEYIEAKGGKDEVGKRPGAQRTDNVKKAIANAALLKAKYPDSYFVVYFSAKPITGSSSAKMIDTALCYKIFNEVRYITDKELIDSQLDLFKLESEGEK